MAAIYSGIHLKLKSPHTPWTDKLKLARFAWISPQCVLPNKEQVLFDWTSHTLTLCYSKKIELSPEVLEGLWAYFDDIIHSKRLQNVLSQGKAVSLRITLAQVINDRIHEHSLGQGSAPLATVLSCLRGILSSPVLSVTYTAKYELLVELLARLTRLICSRLANPQHPSSQHTSPGDPLSTTEVDTLLMTLSSYLGVQRQQANGNRVFTQVTTHLLQPLLVLRHLLLVPGLWSEREGEPLRIRPHAGREIRSKVDFILQAALFSPDILQPLKDELLVSEEEEPAVVVKKARAGKGLASPANTILVQLGAPGVWDSALLYTVMSNSLPILFKSALEVLCKGGDNKLLGFHLMTRFICGLDFTPDLNPKDTFNQLNWNLALLAIDNLLSNCLSEDIYNVAADRIQHGEVQLMFYRKLTRLLFDNAQTATAAWYRCLKTLLALNHLIVEPDLDELLSTMWVDSDCVEPRVCKARDSLVSATLNTYAKLRQLPRLFEELLNVVCRPALDELRPPLLSEAVVEALRVCLLDTPASQCLELSELVLERIQSDVLPDARGDGESGEGADMDAGRKMLSLSTLLHTLLFGLRTLDNATPLPIVRQTQRLMGEMLAIVKPLLEWLQGVSISEGGHHDWKVMESALLLTYTWVEVDALFQMHCSRYCPGEDALQVHGKDNGLRLLSMALVKNWDLVALKSLSPLAKHFQKLLAVQIMKKTLLRSDFALDPTNVATLQSASGFIVGRDEASADRFDLLWDLQLSSVDTNTYQVAHWHLLTTNLPLMAPFLSSEAVAYLSGVLVSSVLQTDTEEVGGRQGLSVSVISKQLMDTVLLVELPSLYSAVLRRLMHSFTDIYDVSHISKSVSKPLEELSGVECEQEEGKDESVRDGGDDVAVTKRLTAVAVEILTAASAGSSVSLSATQVKDLSRLLKVCSELSVDGMSAQDCAELFLHVYLVATCTWPSGDLENSAKTALLRDTYHFLTLLLTGRNNQFILKLAHGSKLLEGALTALFSRTINGLFDDVAEADWVSLLHKVRGFLQRLLDLIIQRKSSVRLNLEQFTTFILAQSQTSTTAITSKASTPTAGSARARFLSLQLSLASLSSASDVMTSSLGKSRQLDQTLLQLLSKILTVTASAVQASLSTGVMPAAGAGTGQAFSVNVVAAMVTSELACHENNAGNANEENAHFVLQHLGLYQSCCSQILRELCPAPRSMDFLLSALHFLSAFYSAVVKIKEPEMGNLFVDVFQNVYKLLSAPWLSQEDLTELLPPVRNLLGQLMVTCSQEHFHHGLMLLRDGLVVSKVSVGSHQEVFAAVTVTRLLASCELPEPCSRALWLIAPQIISSLVFIVRQSGKESSLLSTLTIPTLETLSFLLCKGEGLLSNPHHVTLALGAAQFVPLEHLSVQDFHAAFEAIHEVLFAIIQYHSHVTQTAAPVFLNAFHRLVASVMSEGKQREADRGSDKEGGGEVLRCARLVERMYSHIAATADGFTVLSSFMVAQYVSELQKVTLRPEIKAHLTEGIYQILDLCAERDVKFLNTTLPPGLREVLNELCGSYQRYHKSQRQGEEKYTV